MVKKILHEAPSCEGALEEIEPDESCEKKPVGMEEMGQEEREQD